MENVHFRTTIDVDPQEESQLGLTELIHEVADWIRLKEGPSANFRSAAWFGYGGTWKKLNGRASVEVESLRETAASIPTAWAIRYSHQDNEFAPRWWTIDVGVVPVEPTRWRLALTVGNSLHRTFMGQEPGRLPVTPPRLLTALVSSTRWRCSAGSIQFSITPTVVNIGEGHRLRDAIQETLERPGLQRLLADIDAGLVDQIVVYKVDRLTRSLSDFAKLVERLEAAGAAFVSVTQSFNTATSMGRLTLHMLLSFAQFEREVTAERIRDKVAASKRKGLWMGGRVPLGYEKDERTLRINEAEAETVRTLYALYRKHGTLRQVKAEADHLGLRTKQRLTADGTRTGRLPFRRGHLHCLLTNPLYAGRIRHQRRVYEGQHPSIIAPELWDAVQAQLQAGAAKPRRRTTKGRAARSPLAGKLFDETGDRLTPSHTKKKNGQRLRYYVSWRLIQHSGQKDLSGWRLPAPMLEQTVVHLIRQAKKRMWMPRPSRPR